MRLTAMRLDWPPPTEDTGGDFFTKPLFAACWRQFVPCDGHEEAEYNRRLSEVADLYRRVGGRSVRQRFCIYRGDTRSDTRFVMVSYDRNGEDIPSAYWETDSLAFAKSFVGLMAYYGEIDAGRWRTLEKTLDSL